VKKSAEPVLAVMNGIRSGRLTVELNRRKLLYDMTVRTAERMQAAMLMAMNVTEFDDLVAELADLIEEALESGRPNDTDWVDAFDALWRAEVDAPRSGRTYNKDEPDFRLARKARCVLGQARKVGRPRGSKAEKRKRHPSPPACGA
jgi:hypothetical protein